MKAVRVRLSKYAAQNDLTRPTSAARVEQFETQMRVTLPADVREFLTTIGNGGEILVPGTVFYGIYDRECGRDQDLMELLTYWNRAEIRSHYRMPPGFFVIGTTNYGNQIGIDAESRKIVEWDHETGTPACAWECLRDFLMEEIDLFEQYQKEGE